MQESNRIKPNPSSGSVSTNSSQKLEFSRPPTASATEQSDASRQEEEAVRRVSALLLRRLNESYKKSG